MDSLLQFLGEPLQYLFIQRGLIALVLVGGISALVGSFVVVRGMSFFADALAHAVLPGVAVSYAAGGGAVGANLFVGGLAAGVLSAVVIGYLTRNGRVKEDSAIGIVFVTMFALGIAIISQQGSYAVDLTHILFGSINGISANDLVIMAALGGVILLVIALFYKQLVVVSFDTSLGYTLKLPVQGLRILMLVLVAMTIVASLQAVGIALMLALLITPAATARLLVARLHSMILLSAFLGVTSGVFGFYLSYYLDVPSGPAIVLTMSGVFGVVLLARSLLENARLKRRV
jgi:manganese/iron transport system permease protein